MNPSPLSAFHPCVFSLFTWVAVFGNPQIAQAQIPPREPVLAPAWDARGVGPLPSQGVSSLWYQGGRIVIGTIAPPGDPNVLVLEGDGTLAAHYSVGQRWIENVVELPEEGLVGALCTMPNGTAGDSPSAFLRGSQTTDFQPAKGDFFHYGAHSNHLGSKMLSWARGLVFTSGASVVWHRQENPKQALSANVPGGKDSLGTASAVLPNGDVVVAQVSSSAEREDPGGNLHLVTFRERKPAWARAPLADLPPLERPERGLYGAPTLRDGTRSALKQWDERVSAPLSLAVHASEDGSLERLASADYGGWERWVRSSATLRPARVSVRFLPSQPTITVLDAKGALLRRFDVAKFSEPVWLDLRFLPGGAQLVAWPHRWNCRGLGGGAFLPADPKACTVYLLDVDSGEVRSFPMPGSIADVAILEGGNLWVSCWDGTLRQVDTTKGVSHSEVVQIGGPALLRAFSSGVMAARQDGLVVAYDRTLREKWRVDLARIVPRSEKDWVAKAAAVKLCEGLWQIGGGRVESDLGGQRIVEAPDGLVLLEPHAGLSFEKEWAAIQAAGLDPMRVKFVLATHEHGDHSPGAYLWRLATGAKFVCSEEMAYTLQHHIPANTGYGFHPPVPADLLVREDTELDLAGLKVQAIRVPGHTAGSMAWSFEKENKRWLAIGDLIMPNGPLGYPGSINFSAHDILASLRKLEAVHADFILPGHGPVAPPEQYLGAGIETGMRVGWGKIEPATPDPRFRISQNNVLVAGWGFGIQSAAFGDFNGDGRPDIAVASPSPAASLEEEPKGVTVRIFHNLGGRFAASPDRRIELPDIGPIGLKMSAADVNADGCPDLLVTGAGTVLLLSNSKAPDGFERHGLGVSEAVHLFAGADPSTAPVGVLFARRFGGVQEIVKHRAGGLAVTEFKPQIDGPYVDARWVEKDVFVSSYGHVVRHGKSGVQLEQTGKGWRFFGVGDFNGDGRRDVVFTPQDLGQPAAVHLHTGDGQQPYRNRADQLLAWPKTGKEPRPLVRASLAVEDWDGDGRDDLFMAPGQGREVHVIPGGPAGLDDGRRQVIALDYSLHFETGLYVGDFDGDGKKDLAALGYTATGVGLSGPLAVYIWLQP